MAPSSLRVAIVGAGIAGSACARWLQRAGHQPVVLEKSRGPGGRMSTRRVEWVDSAGQTRVAEFDHGAQYFTARHPDFVALAQAGVEAGWLAEWSPRLGGQRPQASADKARRGEQRLVALPRMPELARRLLEGIPLHTGTRVSGLTRAPVGPGREAWRLHAEALFPGDFDAVALALPAEQAAELLAPHLPAWAARARSAPMLPCWTLMAALDELAAPFDAAWPGGDVLSWVARNDLKPGRARSAGVSLWVAQASPSWSQANLEADPSQVQPALLSALREALGPAAASAAVHHAVVHRWRYARPTDDSPLAVGEPWWDASLGLGVCGDFLGGSRVEAAFLSGEALARQIAAG